MLSIPQRFRSSVTKVIGAFVATHGMLHAAPLPHSLTHTFDSTTTSRQSFSRMAYSSALDAETVVIGSPFDNIGGGESGVVWVHDAVSGSLLHRIDNPNPNEDSHFGWSVAVAGDLVVVGVPDDNTGGSDAGVVFVYSLVSMTPTVPIHTLTNPFPGSDDEFGRAVAISGSRLIVGCPEGDFGAPDTGCAYLYDLSGGAPTEPLVEIPNPDNLGTNFGVSVAIDGELFVVGAVPEDGATDECRVFVYDAAGGSPSVPIWTFSDATPATNDNFGQGVSISGLQVVVSAPTADIGATDSGVAYVFDLEAGIPETPIHTIQNPTPAASDRFGNSIQIFADGLLVGAALDDEGDVDSGQAYYFDLSSPTPDLPTTIFGNPSVDGDDSFGQTVSLHSNRLVIGAYLDSTGASDVGSAYVYELDSGTPDSPVYTINNSSPASHEEFGAAVGISASLVAVGSPKDDRGGTNAGSVNVYDLSAPNPEEPFLELVNPDPSTNDYFGTSVAVSGTRVIVAADHDDTGFSNSGVVYVYETTSMTPGIPFWTIPNPDPGPSEEFGNSVAADGGFVVVGCEKSLVAGVTAGSAYVFDLDSPTPTIPIVVLDHPSPIAGDRFGHSVSISGPYVVVGAIGKNGEAGGVYVFNRLSMTPEVPVFEFDNPFSGAGDEFGASVAVSGDMVIVGAPAVDGGGVDAGAAFIYDLGSASPSVPEHLAHPDETEGAYFGGSIAISGQRFVIGASEDDVVDSESGACYLYDLGSATFPIPGARLEAAGQQEDDFFGYRVAIDGTRVIVGAPGYNADTEDRGVAYLFDPDPPSAEIQLEEPAGNPLFTEGANLSFGNLPVGGTGDERVLVIRNVGTDVLEVSGVAVSGGETGAFSVFHPGLPIQLAVDEASAVQLSFSPSIKGALSTTLQVASNAGSMSLFEVTLSGQALSSEDDSDGDGINDVAELEMEAMGFDWQVNDEELVGILESGANVLELYSGAQLQAANPSMVLLPAQSGSGEFFLTVGVGKSVDLMNFELLPMSAASITINAAGGLDFAFTPSDAAAFFRLEPR